MSRDPRRIARICTMLESVWRMTGTDLRLCQLLTSLAWTNGWERNDLFDWEDDALEDSLIREFIKLEKEGK